MRDWDSLPYLFIDIGNLRARSCVRTVGGMVDVDIIGCALYAIWLTHLDDVSAQQLHTDPSALSTSLSSSEAEAVLRARHAPGSPELRLMATFNNLLSRAIHMLPHHARAVDDDLAFEYRLDARRRGPSVVERSLLPRLRVDYKCLSPSHVSLYREYYARPSPDPTVLPVASVTNGSLSIHLTAMDSVFAFIHSQHYSDNSTAGDSAFSPSMLDPSDWDASSRSMHP